MSEGLKFSLVAASRVVFLQKGWTFYIPHKDHVLAKTYTGGLLSPGGEPFSSLFSGDP